MGNIVHLTTMKWKKDRWDPRDFLHLTVSAIPASVILTNKPSVRDQGGLGSCIGFGIGANLTGWALKCGVYTQWFSPEWIYNGARFIEGTLTQDAGAYPKDALDWIKKMGCLLESYWPYNPNALDKTSPPSKDNAYAAQYPILSYYRCVDGAAGICSALAAGYLVSIGTPWMERWMDIASDGLLPPIATTDDVAGGHETFLYGYDSNKQVFYGQNSWGTGWGNQGLYVMPFQAFSVFKALGGYDAHYVSVNWTKPTPTPTPTPKTRQIRVKEMVNGTATWKTLNLDTIEAGTLEIEESIDGGKTWKELYLGKV